MNDMKPCLLRWTPAAIVLIAGSTNTLAAGLFGASFELSSLNGTNGFVCNGINAYDFSGRCVSFAGDVNADGFDDLIIGAAISSYVVYGAADAGSGGTLDLSSLNGTNGFVCNGIIAAGRTVSSAGDVNGDGTSDLIIGAYKAHPGGKTYAGETYIVFGAAGVGSGGTVDLSTLNGTNGFVLNGIDEGDRSGKSVSSAGDVNGDGIGDLIISA